MADFVLETDAENNPAWGFYHNCVFIVDPYSSECGRFKATPESYGLTLAEGAELARLNAELNQGN